MSVERRGAHAKEIARVTCEALEKDGEAFILLWSFPKEGDVVVPSPLQSEVVPVEEWSPKCVKRFMWEYRNEKALTDPKAVLFAYDTGEGGICMGLARLMDKGAAENAGLPALEIG